MRLAAYTRVSTDTQADTGLGLAVQEQAVRAWAKVAGARLVSVESDSGLSGALDAPQRPGLAKVLTSIARGDVDGLVVHRLDRLARGLTVQEAILARVWSLGASVFSVDLGEVLRDDPADPMRTAMRQMVGVFAQLERGMIAARMASGRQMKAAAGGYAAGAPPFGQRAANGALVPDEDEQRVITRIRGLAESGLSLRAIAAILDAEHELPKRGSRWHPETLRRLLIRTAG